LMCSSTAVSSFFSSSAWFFSFSTFSAFVNIRLLCPCPWSWQDGPQQQFPHMFLFHLHFTCPIVSKIKYLNYKVYTKIVAIFKESGNHVRKCRTTMHLPP
jgi:hypothetical protein